MSPSTPVSDFLRLFGRVFEESPDGVVIGTRDGVTLRANAVACRLLGYTEAQLIALGRAAILVDDEASRKFLDSRRRNGFAHGTVRVRRRDGSTVPVDMTSWVLAPPEGEDFAYVVFRDVSEREQSRQALDDARKKLEAVFANVHDAILLADDEGRYLDANPSACSLLGRRRDEIVGRTIYEMTPVENREAARELWRKFIADGHQSHEYELMRPDGTRVLVEYRAQARILPGVHMSVHQDVTERKRAEEDVRRSEALLRAVAESTPDAIFAKDADGRWTFANPAALGIVSRPAREVLGHTDLEILRDEDAVRPLAENDRKVAQTGAPLVFEESLVTRRGLRRYLTTKAPLRDGGGRPVGLVGVAKDVTELRELEQRFAVTSRLVAVGTLVAGVAHEVNNPLAGALGAEAMVSRSLRKLRDVALRGEAVDPATLASRLGDLLRDLEGARVDLERISRITKDLTTFSRVERSTGTFRLMDAVEDALRWRRQAIADRVTVRVEDRGCPDVLASRGQIGQVVLNLVNNAIDSIPAGRNGTVTLRVGPGSAGMGRLEVEDDGEGMSPEVMERIFDPFFTTRNVGEGTGLGLAVTFAIVNGYGGTISARSEPGKGSTFTVELPAAPTGVP